MLCNQLQKDAQESSLIVVTAHSVVSWEEVAVSACKSAAVMCANTLQPSGDAQVVEQDGQWRRRGRSKWERSAPCTDD